jgi:hypothetical protein
MTVEGDRELMAGIGFDGEDAGVEPPPPQSERHNSETTSKSEAITCRMNERGHCLQNINGSSPTMKSEIIAS